METGLNGRHRDKNGARRQSASSVRFVPKLLQPPRLSPLDPRFEFASKAGPKPVKLTSPSQITLLDIIRCAKPQRANLSAEISRR
jgi:hypothetical protein